MVSLALLLLAAAPPDPDALLERVFEAHGSETLRHATLTFEFRGDRFEARRDGGAFSFTSHRRAPGRPRLVIRVDNRGTNQSQAMAETVNSVVYFATLPLSLRDPAVKTRLLANETIAGRTYHRLEVTFEKEGGGSDYDDRFLYWFRAGSYEMDYLAYRYLRDGGGVRFRVAKNPRSVHGVRFQDYDNYEASLTTKLDELPDSFEQGKLKKLSEILTENVCVKPKDNQRQCE